MQLEECFSIFTEKEKLDGNESPVSVVLFKKKIIGSISEELTLTLQYLNGKIIVSKSI